MRSAVLVIALVGAISGAWCLKRGAAARAAPEQAVPGASARAASADSRIRRLVLQLLVVVAGAFVVGALAATQADAATTPPRTPGGNTGEIYGQLPGPDQQIIYAKYDVNGNFLKIGISANPLMRYPDEKFVMLIIGTVTGHAGRAPDGTAWTAARDAKVRAEAIEQYMVLRWGGDHNDEMYFRFKSGPMIGKVKNLGILQKGSPEWDLLRSAQGQWPLAAAGAGTLNAKGAKLQSDLEALVARVTPDAYREKIQELTNNPKMGSAAERKGILSSALGKSPYSAVDPATASLVSGPAAPVAPVHIGQAAGNPGNLPHRLPSTPPPATRVTIPQSTGIPDNSHVGQYLNTPPAPVPASTLGTQYFATQTQQQVQQQSVQQQVQQQVDQAAQQVQQQALQQQVQQQADQAAQQAQQQALQQQADQAAQQQAQALQQQAQQQADQAAQQAQAQAQAQALQQQQADQAAQQAQMQAQALQQQQADQAAQQAQQQTLQQQVDQVYQQAQQQAQQALSGVENLGSQAMNLVSQQATNVQQSFNNFTTAAQADMSSPSWQNTNNAALALGGLALATVILAAPLAAA